MNIVSKNDLEIVHEFSPKIAHEIDPKIVHLTILRQQSSKIVIVFGGYLSYQHYYLMECLLYSK
jgi:hypothetical protein